MQITYTLLVAGILVPSMAAAEDVGRRWSFQAAGGSSSPVGISADFDDLWTTGLGLVARASYDLNRSFAVVGGLEFSNFPFKTNNGYAYSHASGSQVVTGRTSSIWSGTVSLKAIPVRWVVTPYILLGTGISRVSPGDVTLGWEDNDCPTWAVCSGQTPYPSRSHVTIFEYIGGGLEVSLGKSVTIFGEANLRIAHSGGVLVDLHTTPAPSIDSPTIVSVVGGLSFRP